MRGLPIGSLRRGLKALIPSPLLAWRQRFLSRRFRDQNRSTVFTAFYRNNLWASEESRSGGGSELERTQAIRGALPSLLRELGATSILDIPCGDFNWMQHVDLPGCTYIGADIVPDLIASNRATHAAPGREFVVLDLVEDPLPTVDVLLVRDCLIHLPNADIQRALSNIKRSGSRYLLTNTYPAHRGNYDTATGGARCINLALPPFNLPAPRQLIAEVPALDPARHENADKSMGLWRVSDLPNFSPAP